MTVMNEFIEEKLPDVQLFLNQLTVCPETIPDEPARVSKESKDVAVKAIYAHLLKIFPKFLKLVRHQYHVQTFQANVSQKPFFAPLITIVKDDITPPELLKQAQEMTQQENVPLAQSVEVPEQGEQTPKPTPQNETAPLVQSEEKQQ